MPLLYFRFSQSEIDFFRCWKLIKSKMFTVGFSFAGDKGRHMTVVHSEFTLEAWINHFKKVQASWVTFAQYEDSRLFRDQMMDLGRWTLTCQHISLALWYFICKEQTWTSIWSNNHLGPVLAYLNVTCNGRKWILWKTVSATTRKMYDNLCAMSGPIYCLAQKLFCFFTGAILWCRLIKGV